eukprot:sb/3463864/
MRNEVRQELAGMENSRSQQVNMWKDKIKQVLDFGQRRLSWTGLDEDVPDLEADSADEIPQPGEQHNEPTARYFPHLSFRRHASVGLLVGATSLIAARVLVHRPTSSSDIMGHNDELDDEGRDAFGDRYTFVRNLGGGTFGDVCEAIDNENDSKLVAIKKLKTAFKDARNARMTYREISLLSRIIRILDVIGTTAHDDIKSIYLVMEYSPGTLCDLLSAIEVNNRANHEFWFRHYSNFRFRAPLTLICTSTPFLSAVTSIAYSKLTRKPFQDLKPGNIGFDCDNFILKILDFGLARSDGLDPMLGNHPVFYSPDVGTRAYQAPEVALGLEYDGSDVDIWSAGCIFAELFLGEILFPARNMYEQFMLIVRELGEPPEEMTGQQDTNVQRTIESFAELPRSENIESIRLLDDENDICTEGSCTYTNAVDCISRMITYTNRITVEDLLEHEFFNHYRYQENERIPPEDDLLFHRQDMAETENATVTSLAHWKAQPQKGSCLSRALAHDPLDRFISRLFPEAAN